MHAILNISPDHIERHGNLNSYVKSKFKLIKNQNKDDFSFLDFKNKYLKKFLKQNNLKSKMINVNEKTIFRKNCKN